MMESRPGSIVATATENIKINHRVQVTFVERLSIVIQELLSNF